MTGSLLMKGRSRISSGSVSGLLYGEAQQQ